MHDLGTLNNGGSYPTAINSHGDVVGYSPFDTNSEPYVREDAFLYTAAGGMVDLNSLIGADSNWHLEFAMGINDAGQITGTGIHYLPNFGATTAAFILTPVPEPESVVLAGCALAGLFVWAFCYRRRSRSIARGSRWTLPRYSLPSATAAVRATGSC